MVKLESVYKVKDGVEILYALLRERSTEDDPHTNISHRKLPPYAEHVKYVAKRPYRYWYLIFDEEPVGTCYISKLNEIGIVLFREHRGKGYGFNAVADLVQRHKPLPEIPGKRAGRFLANINPKNERSIRMFTKLGMTLHQVTYAL